VVKAKREAQAALNSKITEHQKH